MNIVPHFDEGQHASKAFIVNDLANTPLAQCKLQQSKARIAGLQTELGGALQKSGGLKRQIAYDAEIKAKFNEGIRLFFQQEANVFRQGNNVILRLVGLNVPVGLLFIETKNDERLGKVYP